MATPLPAFIKQNLYGLFKKRIIQIKSSISTQYKYQSLYRIMKPFFNTLRLKFESLLFIEELPFLLVNLVRVFLRFLIQEKFVCLLVAASFSTIYFCFHYFQNHVRLCRNKIIFIRATEIHCKIPGDRHCLVNATLSLKQYYGLILPAPFQKVVLK